VSNNSFVVACVFVATGACLLSHCLATIRGDTDKEQGDLISLLLFIYLFIFQKRESRLKTFGLAYTYTVI
jgi:hypothetical protein